MFETEAKKIEEKIQQHIVKMGLELPPVQWKWIPFSGYWGISTSFFQVAANEARQGDKKINVGERAQEIALSVASALGTPAGFARTEAVKGYLNLYFSTQEYAARVVDTVLEEKQNFGRLPQKNQKVMVEFSQPNTHKAFHVGHLRNVILGNAVCNILDFAGNQVIRANYIGDIGLHVIKWLWNYINHHQGETPGENKTRWMGDLYAEADQYFNDNLDVQMQVRDLFARWDQRDPEIVALWQKTRQWSMEGFEQVYKFLNVPFDRFYFESDVEDSGKVLVEDLIRRGIAKDERPEGTVIIPLDDILGLEKEKYRVLVILRSDGTSLYSTKDLPLAIQKFEEYGLDRSVYVIDVRQSLYMQQIYKTLEIMGYEWAKNCFHLAYEIVNLPGNVTMSSRDGTVVLLEDLVEEATLRAISIVKEKNPVVSHEKQKQIALQVALGAIKYSMLSRDNTKIVTFDWDSALDFNGQAAPYIQYAHVRANSILRKARENFPAPIIPTYELTPEEIQLIDLITRLPQEVERSANEFRPLYIANLAYDLAATFNSFYNKHRVLQAEEPVRNMRLRLVAAAQQTIANCLCLLGINSPEAM